ncbi:MAG: Fic family protein [bacterium]|nr:Fic family protein [bacterium]
MHIPLTPPATEDEMRALVAQGSAGAATLSRIFGGNNDAAPGGRYRHWDKLRHLVPPDGLTHGQWWLSIRLARGALSQALPLRDVQGRPFTFAMPDAAQRMVHAIDRDASGAIESLAPLPTPHDRLHYLQRSLGEEAITSSQLEGAATTRKVARQMLREQREPRNRGERMILNNYRGLRFIAERTREADLTPEFIHELHAILTEGTLDDLSAAGRFRRDDEQIVVQDENALILHTPPSAVELPGRLQALCDFANSSAESPFVHPVVRSILLHFWLAYDHPFTDGNGRTARALFYWSMARHGYWLMEYVSISSLLLQAPSRYARAFLYTETDGNDTTYFLLHQMETIERAIHGLHAWLDRRMAERRRSLDLLKAPGAGPELNHRQLALVRHGLDHPGALYSIQGHRGYHQVSYGTARADLLGLSKAGLLELVKVGRAFQFVAPDDLDRRLKSGPGDAGTEAL